MKTFTFAKDWPVRLNERQDTIYLAGMAYPLDSDMEGRARAAGVLAEGPGVEETTPNTKAKRAP